MIATDIPAGLRRPGIYRGVLHETRDQAAMFAPVTRSATLLDDADAIGSAVLSAGARALAAPRSGVPGNPDRPAVGTDGAAGTRWGCGAVR